MSKQAEIRAKCAEVFAKAAGMYGLDFSNVEIRFDLKGKCAGTASRKMGRYTLRFNFDMLQREAFDHVLNDTVPHEIAHLVCYMNPMLGSKHNPGWAQVCRRLGGSGARCHQEEVVYGKGRTFEYTSTTGHVCRISETIHKRIQAGQARTFAKRALGQLNNACAYSIVGEQGRTFAKPVVRTPSPTATPYVAPVRTPVRAYVAPRAPAPQPTYFARPAVQLTAEAKALMGWKAPVPSYNPSK